MIKDFKTFVMRGNVIDMAVGIIIGAAFGGIVNSLVKDVIMPPIGLVLGNLDFSNLAIVLKEGSTAGPYPTPAAAQAAGAVTLNYGLFVNTVINFIIIAFVVFFFIVRPIARTHTADKKTETELPLPTTKKCPFCITDIALKASRCPNCTSALPEER